MKITPLDIRKQEFRKAVRGLDQHEVQAFLEMVANEMEEVVKENTSLSGRMRDLDQKIEDYRRMEKTLQDTLTSAQRTTDELRRNAEKEAEIIVRNARIQADHLLEEARSRISSLKTEIISLQNQRDSFLAALRGLVDAQGRMLTTYEAESSQTDVFHSEPAQGERREERGAGEPEESLQVVEEQGR